MGLALWHSGLSCGVPHRHALSECQFKSWLPGFQSAFLLMCLGRQQETVQQLPLPLTRESSAEFGPALLSVLQPCGERTSGWKIFVLLSAFYINKSIFNKIRYMYTHTYSYIHDLEIDLSLYIRQEEADLHNQQSLEEV